MNQILLPVVRQIGPALILALLAFAFFLLALDQGQVLGAVVGEVASEENWLHEFFHDARHIGAFPCH